MYHQVWIYLKIFWWHLNSPNWNKYWYYIIFNAPVWKLAVFPLINQSIKTRIHQYRKQVLIIIKCFVCYSTSLPSRNLYQIQRNIEVPVKHRWWNVFQKLKAVNYFRKTCHHRCLTGYQSHSKNNPGNIYLFVVNNRNTGKRSEICSKLKTKTSERCQWSFEHISHLFLVFLLLTLSK